MSLKFSIQIENQFGYDWEQTKKIILETEKHGYHSFYICDHFFLDANSEERNALEAWTVLTAAAGITENIMLGTLVSGNNYRNPAYLAKVASSLDMISNGRMEFGIGAGWKKIEYEAYGYDFPSVKDRMEMLEESIQVIKAMWSQPKATFEGKHYRIKDAFCAPKPVQESPLFLIGGNGEKKTLKLVAKYADYCNLLFLSPDQIQVKLDALRGHCKDISRDFDDVGKSLFTQMWVGESEEEVDAYIESRAKRANMSVEDIKSRIFHPDAEGSWIGTPEQVRDRVEYMQGLGFDYFHFQQPFDLSADMVEKFGHLVKSKYFN